MNFYVYLQLSAKSHEDSFTVELGCAPGEYPFDYGARDPNQEKNGATRFADLLLGYTFVTAIKAFWLR